LLIKLIIKLIQELSSSSEESENENECENLKDKSKAELEADSEPEPEPEPTSKHKFILRLFRKITENASIVPAKCRSVKRRFLDL
jgi:hypothetical protein